MKNLELDGSVGLFHKRDGLQEAAFEVVLLTTVILLPSTQSSLVDRGFVV